MSPASPDSSGSLDLKSLIRPAILGLRPYSSAREKIQQGILLDANESPYPWPWQGRNLNRYPDPLQRDLRSAIAKQLGISAGRILASSGSDEVIDWILKVFCEPGRDSIAVAVPSYGMYRVQAEILGIKVESVPLNSKFDLVASDFARQLSPEVRVVFLCSPNNPTGNLLCRDQLLEFIESWPGIVVLDEAYIEFSELPSLLDVLSGLPNLILLRTFSKARGAAGLRLGYTLASERIIDYFVRVKLPYNLSQPIQALGLLALERTDWREQVAEIRDERERIAEALNRLPGLRVFPSQANFLLFECPAARFIHRYLFERGIVIRDRSGLPGLESCLRISIGQREENDQFLEVLSRAIEEVENV